MSNFLNFAGNQGTTFKNHGTGGGTSFTLDVNASTNSVLLTVGGVLQAPGTDYTVSGTTITTTSSVTAGIEVFSWVIHKPGTAPVIQDNSVETSKIVDGAVTAAKIASGAVTSLDTIDAQVFTSSGTWTKPSGLVFAIVFVTGGGGGGGKWPDTSAGAGGGAGGGTAIEVLLASELGATETVTVGAGGAGATSGGSAGSTGGTSSFGALCSATGGEGGGSTGGGSDAQGGVGSGGDINIYGDDGSRLSAQGTPAPVWGGGSFFGGLTGGRIDGSGTAGVGYGAGGTGTSSSNNAGAGAAGVVLVWEFIA